MSLLFLSITLFSTTSLKSKAHSLTDSKVEVNTNTKQIITDQDVLVLYAETRLDQLIDTSLIPPTKDFDPNCDIFKPSISDADQMQL